MHDEKYKLSIIKIRHINDGTIKKGKSKKEALNTNFLKKLCFTLYNLCILGMSKSPKGTITKHEQKTDIL